MVAHPVPSIAGAGAGKDVEAGLNPVVKTVSNLDGLMQSVVGGREAVVGCFAAIHGEVRVEFDHGGPGLDCIGAIHLNFVVVLRPGGGQSSQQNDSGQELTEAHNGFNFTGFEQPVRKRWEKNPFSVLQCLRGAKVLSFVWVVCKHKTSEPAPPPSFLR